MSKKKHGPVINAQGGRQYHIQKEKHGDREWQWNENPDPEDRQNKFNKIRDVATNISEETGRKLMGDKKREELIRGKMKFKKEVPVVLDATLPGVVDEGGRLRGKELTMDVPGMGRLTGLKPDTNDPRPVVAQFYLAILKALVSGDVQIQAACNFIGAPYPKCVQHGSIIHESAHQFEKARGERFTPRQLEQFVTSLNLYIGQVFYGAMRDARIFQFKEADYWRLYHIADVVTTIGAGYKWAPRDPNNPFKDAPDEEIARTAEFTVKEGANLPFPEKVPFRACYMAWGTGVVPSVVQCQQYGLDVHRFQLVMGTVITAEGWVFTIVLKGNKDTVGFAIGRDGNILGGMQPIVVVERVGNHTHHQEVKGHGHDEVIIQDQMMSPGWSQPYDLVPWMVVRVIEIIERNDSLAKVQPGNIKERMQFRAVAKRTGQSFVPPPYYTVLIQPTTYKEVETAAKKQAREWSHQWDVIGHYGHKIRRGFLPIDPKLVKKLEKRKYEIFHALHPLKFNVVEYLEKHREPLLREGEWLAFLEFWRDNYIKGPADKPYIPSVHKLKGGLRPS